MTETNCCPKKRRTFKRLSSLFVLFITLSLTVLSALPVNAVEDPVIENVTSAYVCCLNTGEVLYQHNPEAQLFTTSSTKMMTAILAIEAFEGRYDEKVTVTSKMLSEVSGNRLGLKSGEEVTVRDLIHVLVTGGNNDGAYCLAYLTAGSVNAFVDKMNEKAESLGAFNTFYTNPTGMHNDQMVTTISDTAIIAKYAWSLPLFEEASSTPKYVMEATNLCDYRNIYNRNCLISRYYDAAYYRSDCAGINAGSTKQGGHCVITVASDEDLSYLVIAMGGESTEDKIYSYSAVHTMIDWAFSNFSMVDVLFEKQMVYEIPVNLSGAVDFVTLAPSKTVSVFLPADVDTEKEIKYSWSTYEESLDAPITAGQVVGQISATYNEEVLGTCDLVVTSDVERSEFLYNLSKIEKLTKSKGFIASVIAAILITVGVVFFNAYRRKNIF